MRSIVIDEEHRHPIRPHHIDTNEHFVGAFGAHEMEEAARWIVRFSQLRGLWAPFHVEEITRFYRETSGHPHPEDFSLLDFDSLASRGFLVYNDRGNQHRATHVFICRCFESSPASAAVGS